MAEFCNIHKITCLHCILTRNPLEALEFSKFEVGLGMMMVEYRESSLSGLNEQENGQLTKSKVTNHNHFRIVRYNSKYLYITIIVWSQGLAVTSVNDIYIT